MKKITVLLILPFTALFVSGTLIAQDLTAEQLKSVISEVDSSFNENLRAGENFNVKGIYNCVDDSRRAGHIFNGIFYLSFDSVMAGYEYNVKNLRSLDYDIKNKRLTVLSPDAAIVAVSGIANAETISGQRFSTGFAWTFIYLKINNQWKVIHSHRSSPK